MRSRSALALLSLLPLAVLAAGDPLPQESAPVENAAAQAAELLGRVADETPLTVWSDALALQGLGKGAVPALTAALSNDREVVRLAAASALCGLGAEGPACQALAELARKGSPEGRGIAVRLMGEHGGMAGVKPLLGLLEDDGLSRRDRIAVSQALWQRSRNMKAPQFCREAMQDSDPAVRNAALLALGDMGMMADARAGLETLALTPTEDGVRARRILLQDQLAQVLASQERPELKEGEALLSEMVAMVQRYYVDAKKSDLEALFEAAAKGMASSLDPHSSYMGRKEVEDMNQRMDGHYAGVGAVVQLGADGVMIQSAFFDGPAYKAGIRSGDIITKIEGQNVVDFSLEDSVKLLKGVPGTEVALEIVRRGVTKPVVFRLKRAIITLKSVHAEMLPGKVGYVRLTQFVKQSGDDLRQALEALKKEGMRSLVLDLRENGGGLLLSAVQIGDLFLKSGSMIVYSEGRSPEVAPREEYYAGGHFDGDGRWVNPPAGAQRAPPMDYPIAVLVNKGSASASEIVSGALRDHARAVLVGEKTFGKGSVQQLRRLESTKNETMFRITVAKYYLPSGRCIHGLGVEPDITVETPDIAGWKFEEYRRLADAKAFQNYLDAHPVTGHAALAALAADDGRDVSLYPGFAEWYGGLKTTLSQDDVRLFLRRLLRDRVAEDRGKEFVTDLDDDVQLQRAALEALRRSGADPKTLPEYAPILERFNQAEAPPSK